MTDRFEQWMDALAPALGLEVPAACRPGVLANLAVLQRHLDTLMAVTLDDAVETAPRFEP